MERESAIASAKEMDKIAKRAENGGVREITLPGKQLNRNKGVIGTIGFPDAPFQSRKRTVSQRGFVVGEIDVLKKRAEFERRCVQA